MSPNASLHLKEGDAQPPLKEGLLRLYSMRFCPFAQRAHLALDIKNVPYETVYVNLVTKPSWIHLKSKGGLVPAIEFADGTCLSESLIIADYINEEYPDSPLYPKDPKAKAFERLLIEKFASVTKALFNALLYSELNEESFEHFLKELEPYEVELKKRKTTFFGGVKPNMLDLMIWPMMERVPMAKIHGGSTYELPKSRFPSLVAWNEAMLAEPAIKSSYQSPENHYKYLSSKKNNKTIYDF